MVLFRRSTFNGRRRGDAKKASRDYSFEVSREKGKAPVISVFGGKITTYRKLAEAATDKLCQFFPHARGPWTKTGILPGGDFENRDTLEASLSAEYPWLPEAVYSRYVRTYGTKAYDFLATQNPSRIWDFGLPAHSTSAKSSILSSMNGR